MTTLIRYNDENGYNGELRTHSNNLNEHGLHLVHKV